MRNARSPNRVYTTPTCCAALLGFDSAKSDNRASNADVEYLSSFFRVIPPDLVVKYHSGAALSLEKKTVSRTRTPHFVVAPLGRLVLLDEGAAAAVVLLLLERVDIMALNDSWTGGRRLAPGRTLSCG